MCLLWQNGAVWHNLLSCIVVTASVDNVRQCVVTPLMVTVIAKTAWAGSRFYFRHRSHGRCHLHQWTIKRTAALDPHRSQTTHKMQQLTHAVGDGRLCRAVPGSATWQTGRNIRVVFDSVPFAPLSENMTSSTKPEVHNVLHCRQRRTEPRSQVTCTENLVKVGRMVWDMRADKQTNRQTNGWTEIAGVDIERGREKQGWTLQEWTNTE